MFGGLHWLHNLLSRGAAPAQLHPGKCACVLLGTAKHAYLDCTCTSPNPTLHVQQPHNYFALPGSYQRSLGHSQYCIGAAHVLRTLLYSLPGCNYTMARAALDLASKTYLVTGLQPRLAIIMDIALPNVDSFVLRRTYDMQVAQVRRAYWR